MPTRYFTVADTGEIPPDTAIQIWIDDQPVAVYNLNGEFFATSDICTHEEFFLHGGVIENGEIECPLHRGVYNIRTGKAEVYPAEIDLQTFRCRVVNGSVQVGVET